MGGARTGAPRAPRVPSPGGDDPHRSPAASQGIRGATPGEARDVAVTGNTFNARIAAGHSLLAWASASELGFYKPYVPSLGGTLEAGPGSTLTLPPDG